MFGWFKRKSTPPPSAPAPASTNDTEAEGEAVLSFVLLNTAESPLKALAQQMARATCAGHRFSKIEITDDTLTAEYAGGFIAIGMMPPYPWSELEGPCTTSKLWPPEASPLSLKDHKAHLLITMLRGGGTPPGPIDRRLRLTALTALAARAPGAVGVYWPDAGQVHFPPVFIEMADTINTPQAPPLYLWIDFRLFRNDDGTPGLFTTGLNPLGHMELEIPSIDMDPADLRDWAVNIAYYLLENGPVLQDGNTIGISAEHQVKIRHLPSKFGHEGKVLCFGE